MDILTQWLRSYLPALPVDDRQLAEDLTLRGIAVEGEFTVPGGSRFEMDITTNRVDAMNHYGVAREAAAIYGVPLRPLEDWVPHSSVASSPMSGVGDAFPVRIEADDLCGRFTARVIRGVTVRPSTGLIADYFAALGQKQISAPVDVTNFGWLAIGQPTHAFDLDKIEGGIVVRRARPGEKLQLLDGTERTLVADDLVVADERKPLALAGVMGGWDSRVTGETKNILVEAAWFSPASIRASSRRHGLHTDASHRFERGADFAIAPTANNLVARLIVEQCGGEITGPLADITIPAIAAQTANRAPINLSVAEVQRHLGTTLDGNGISADVVERFLTALGCTLTPTGPGTYAVQLPSWRLDLEREIDLIEEVARVYGYNKFADTLPTFTGTVIELPHSDQETTIRETLRALGFSEAISSTFASADEAALFGNASGSVAMGNPLSEEAGMLRPSLVPGMATMLAHNLHRDVSDVRLFELGTVFTGSTAQVDEATGLAIGATGAPVATSLHSANDALFYEMKGALETLLAKFDGTVTFDAADLPAWLEPGRTARALLDATPVAWFGELASAEAHRRKLRQTCVLAEVHSAALLTRPLRQPASRELSRFQAVERDFSFIFPDTVRWEAIAAALAALNIAEMQRVSPIEFFRDPKGKAVAAGSYSALIRARFQSNDRTLTEEEILAWYNSIIATLTTLGGTQRA
ncbi:MAG TPA: phenylalanine--tRNA ligase subunit beta [Acidobacteriaceae bacterium]|nr:phenylalanine--tRNA ligase subunit beta [Acidobacteriaceae bacterium]